MPPEFYIVGFERPNPMARQEDAKYHELLVTNFDPSPMLNRQLSLLELPTMESSDPARAADLVRPNQAAAPGVGLAAGLRIRGENKR